MALDDYFIDYTNDRICEDNRLYMTAQRIAKYHEYTVKQIIEINKDNYGKNTHFGS